MTAISSEINEEVILKVKSGIPVKKIAKDYGISDRTIYGWLKKKAVSSISVLEFNKLKKENTLLKEIIGALTIEVEKLKKKTGNKQ